MGSEIFNLKSLYLEDTVVRGARVSSKNAKITRTIEVNPGDDPGDVTVVKTGETGVNEDYLIQSSLAGNDLKGYGTFTNNSDLIQGYTGAQNLNHGDLIRLDGDKEFYTITGIQGATVFLVEKYTKEDIKDPSVKSGSCVIKKIKLDSVKFEYAKNNVTYDKDSSEWGVTGIQMSDPTVAPSEKFNFDVGVDLKFEPGSSKKNPDLTTVQSVYKTLLDNNTSPIYDVSLSPLPFPHESLQVFIGKSGEELKKGVEFEDYVVNYSQSPELKYPRPPYEERESAYLKFLGKIENEAQVNIDGSFEGRLTVSKNVQEGNSVVSRPIQDIVPSDDFSINVGVTNKEKNFDCTVNHEAGIVNFVDHNNSELLIDTISYPKKLIWDGISVIKGVKEEDVKNEDDLVIPGVSGIKDIDYEIFFEDNDEYNLLRDTDYIIDPESGAFSLISPLKKDEAVLISYYTEGEDIENEKINLNFMRLSSFPLIIGSLTLTEKYISTSEEGVEVTKNRVLVEGADFTVSYITGFISLISDAVSVIELKATYTPMAQIHCVAQSVQGDQTSFRYTIVNDVLSISDTDNDNILLFKVNNPVVSIPKKILFDSDKVNGNYNFDGSIIPENIVEIKTLDNSTIFNIHNALYNDLTKEISLDKTINTYSSNTDDIIVGTYSYESDILPYAPVLLIYTLINAGDNSFSIEGYDKTDVLKADSVLRVDNRDPQSSAYFFIKEVSYSDEKTIVEIYGTFPEDIQDPTFYVFDDQVNWVKLPLDVPVDTTSPVGADQVILKGNPLYVASNIKPNTLMLFNDKSIYNVTSVSIESSQAVVGIYPALRSVPTETVWFSRSPIYEEGLDSLSASQFVLEDPVEPAFTLYYQAPEGFEGGAKILFTKEKITIEESISGIKNPELYEYIINSYSDVYSLAKAIQATQSTFNHNVPYMSVPDYNPFTIAENGREKYYLGTGYRNTSSLISFEEESFLDLPYTFTISPELYKWSLLELFKGKKEFKIFNLDVTSVLIPGLVLAFKNKISGNYFFTKVVSASFSEENNVTTIKISSMITENMVGPISYTFNGAIWNVLNNKIVDIDYTGSIIKFSGALNQNVREGTLIDIDSNNILQVEAVIEHYDSFELTLNSKIPDTVKTHNFVGYVKYSSRPVPIDHETQPDIQITYTEPKAHTGTASIVISDESITIKEVIDNYKIKETTFELIKYKSYNKLFSDIIDLESYVLGVKPFNVIISGDVEDIYKDNFSKYRLPVQNSSLSCQIKLGINAFDISYVVPSGCQGSAEIKILSDSILLKEKVTDQYSQYLEKETTILFNNTSSINDLVTRVIPGISSAVSPDIYPFLSFLKNSDFFKQGLWDGVTVIQVNEDYQLLPQSGYAVLFTDSWIRRGSYNERKLEIGTDYEIENGSISITEPISVFDRYKLSYMGLDTLLENEGESIICSCRFITSLSNGSRVDVYMDYLNIDQFFIQKVTERKFSEIVVAPQIEDLLYQKGTGGGQSSDSGANSDYVPVYSGGVSNLTYAIQDEYIKKQLYIRFYYWYKQRLRALSAEMQLGIGFKFGHSNAVGEVNNYYSIDDQYVENEDYTLTSDEDIGQINNGFSKFFPIGYNGQAPAYYNRFGKEYLSYAEVYCCNVKYKDKGEIITVGVIKSDKPYWNRTSDLIFKVWEDEYINKNLVGYYSVDVPENDRVFNPITYTFLRVVDSGDKVKIDGFKSYYTISEIRSPEGKEYEFIVTNKSFTDKGIKTYDISSKDFSFDTFIENLPPDGYKLWIQRQDKETFPMFDDGGNLGATAYGESIEGHVKNSRRIKKPFMVNLLRLLFPFPGVEEPSKKFKIWVKKDSEAPWESAGSIDLSKLTFKEERNVDDVLDGLRYDFVEKATLPGLTLYDIEESDSKGFHRFFYMSFERIYDADSPSGYYEGIILKAKNRNYWFKITNDSDSDNPIVEDYGFDGDNVYKNFYDPDNVYKKLLLEKQGWETEELVIRDLYDHSDKIARAFDEGNLNKVNSKYQNYLAMPQGGLVSGISDILKSRIPSYEKQLRFLIDAQGPVFRTLFPDLVHAEDSATPDIALTYNQTLQAFSIYTAFYNRMLFYYTLNNDNNNVWKNDYVKWVLSLEKGLLYQKDVKRMYEQNTSFLTVGLQEISAIKISKSNQTAFVIEDSKVTVSSTYEGKYISISFNLSSMDSPNIDPIALSYTVNLYNKDNSGGVTSIQYKSLSQVGSEISSYRYQNTPIFNASNVFEHYENSVTDKMCLVYDQPIDDSNGIILNVVNVADHRGSDPRILFLNKNIEDRIYTHGIRELPGLKLSYLGNFYSLNYDTPGISIRMLNTYGNDFSYGVFLDETGEKSLTLKYTYIGDTISRTFELYEKIIGSDNTIEYKYKTLSDIVSDINTSGLFISSVIGDESILGDIFRTTESYIVSSDDVVQPLIHPESSYDDLSSDINQCYYKVYRDNVANKKLEIFFYELILDGRTIRVGNNILETFHFNLQNTDGSYKTLRDISTEVSNYVYKGEKIFVMEDIYELDPNGDISCSYVLIQDVFEPIGFDLEDIIYVDTYLENNSNDQSQDRNVSNLKNAYFSFPVYTANGKINKTAIEGIPVSGNWEDLENEAVIKIECLDGDSWDITFSDYDSGDYKSYMVPQEVLDLIDRGTTITQEQYNQIKVVEDRPSVAVLKELILTRNSNGDGNILRINLREYDTISKLVQAIVSARFNDSGEEDPEGYRAFFTASLIGSEDVQGKYKSFELYARYTPIVRSFTVEAPTEYNPFNIEYKSNQLIGWEISKVSLSASQEYNLRISQKRYSQGSSYRFKMNGPEQAYMDTLLKNPQGFRRDISAFDIYSWDTNAQYEIKDNWIYFKSSSVNYSITGDLGQPNKLLGYGIPLAGSGHPQASPQESISDLIYRINSNFIVNKFFYANLKFTRDNTNDPGNFEYNYLPNYASTVPKSTLDNVMLKNDAVFSVVPGVGYVFGASNISVNDSVDTMDISCDWSYDYNYERVFQFNSSANSTLANLKDSVNNELAPEIALSLAETNVITGFSSTSSKLLIPTYVEKPLTTTYTDIKINTISGPEVAFQIKLRALSGSNFVIKKAEFKIPSTKDRLIIKCSITYHDTFSLVGYSLIPHTIGTLVDYIASIKHYTGSAFNTLFKPTVYSDVFRNYEANRLLDMSDTIHQGSTPIQARLDDVVALRLLNMNAHGTMEVSSDRVTLYTIGSYTAPLPVNNDLHAWVDNVRGDYVSGFIAHNVLPIKFQSVDYGNLNINSYSLKTDNIPAHVYFGVLGDIRFVQISDYNLHVQYNHIKERLGKPWKDDQGNLIFDYYTPENFNENNPYAIDLDNFLGYLKSVRYNQIKNSIINEAIVSNKYFWLYMKFHKEFGCDQRVIALKDQIQKREQDIEILDQIN